MSLWERYKPKPFWRSEYREAYFEQAGRNLLFAFILSISLNPFYVVLLSDKETLNYVHIEDRTMSSNGVFNSIEFNKQRETFNNYRLIDSREIKRIKEFENSIWWITITALLGWCSTSPRFLNGTKKIMEKIKNE
jgi:hypothetical protein